MAEDGLEQQNIQPIKEVPLGQWFKPFEDYGKTPYDYRPDDPEGKEYFTKRFRLTTPSIGEWWTILHWEGEEYEGINRNPELGFEEKNIIVLPDTEIITSHEREVFGTQKELTRRLMILDFMIPGEFEFYSNDVSIEIKLPSGKVLLRDSRIGSLPRWIDRGNPGNAYTNLFIPETQNVMQKIELKIDKARGGEMN